MHIAKKSFIVFSFLMIGSASSIFCEQSFKSEARTILKMPEGLVKIGFFSRNLPGASIAEMVGGAVSCLDPQLNDEIVVPTVIASVMLTTVTLLMSSPDSLALGVVLLPFNNYCVSETEIGRHTLREFRKVLDFQKFRLRGCSQEEACALAEVVNSAGLIGGKGLDFAGRALPGFTGLEDLRGSSYIILEQMRDDQKVTVPMAGLAAAYLVWEHLL